MTDPIEILAACKTLEERREAIARHLGKTALIYSKWSSLRGLRVLIAVTFGAVKSLDANGETMHTDQLTEDLRIEVTP